MAWPVSRTCSASVTIFRDEPTRQSLSARAPNRHCFVTSGSVNACHSSSDVVLT